MAVEVRVTQVGSLLGVALPEFAVERLKVREGDYLQFEMTPAGIVLTPLDSAIQEQLKAMDEVIAEHSATLDSLSK